jgi:hypothetical protein
MKQPTELNEQALTTLKNNNMNFQKNTSTQDKVSIIRRAARKIQNVWRAYSRAVDMAYNRCQTYEHSTEIELCGCSDVNTTLTRKNRPFKASVFNDYSSDN